MRNNLIVAILIIALLVAGYWWYVNYAARPAVVVERASGETPTQLKETLDALATLQKIKIDNAFFDDTLYKGLINFAPPIQLPAVQGRSNPFLPIGAGAGIAKTQ